MRRKNLIVSAALMLASASSARASMNITEWMYNGKGASNLGEFAEFTNTGSTPVDMTGWSFDDSTRTPGSESLSAFGTVAPGQSVVFTDDTAAHFRTNWGLSASVLVIGGNMDNLGRGDEINLYDNANNFVDRLTYDDAGDGTPAPTGTVAGPRANGVSANILPANYGQNNASLAVLSAVGDQFGSHTSSLGEIGSPGSVPEPASIGLLAVAGIIVGRRGRAVKA